jgi:hypothetical protein
VGFLLQGVWGKSLQTPESANLQFRLTVFVKHQVNWLNRFYSLPSGKEKNPKHLKGRDFMVFSGAKAFRCSLSFHRKYMPHRIYRGTGVYFIRSPHPCLCRGPPSGHASLLGYFDKSYF